MILKNLKKRSIQKFTWLYFLLMAFVIVCVILCVELVMANFYTYSQGKRVENCFKASETLALDMKRDFEDYKTRWEANQNLGYKSLDEYKERAAKIASKYNCENEFYIFSYAEISEDMDLKDALYSSDSLTDYGDNGYYTSNETALYNAKETIFVKNPDEGIPSQMFNVFDYTYNIYRDIKIFDYGNTDFGDANTTTRIYGGSLTKITAAGVNRRILLYMRVSIRQNEIGVTMMIVSAVSGALISLLLSFVLSTFLSRRISRPIKQYADAAEKLGQGDYRQKLEIDEKSFYELQQLGYAFNHAAEEIEKTDQQRKEFLANVTHDLRTPLTMIRAYAEMIRDISGANEAKRKTHTQIIIDEADRLSLLVEDILNVSKLEAGTLKMEFVPTDMTTLCRTALSLYTIKVEKEGYHILSELDEGAVAVADGQRITQVIHNLVQNAVNYTGEDKTVKVRLKRLDNGIRIEVSDSGPGIAPEEIDSVWTRYYQINQKKRNKMGSGLGLDIARGILTAHNARFGIDSQLGKGTTFWFELDNKPVDDEDK